MHFICISAINRCSNSRITFLLPQGSLSALKSVTEYETGFGEYSYLIGDRPRTVFCALRPLDTNLMQCRTLSVHTTSQQKTTRISASPHCSHRRVCAHNLSSTCSLFKLGFEMLGPSFTRAAHSFDPNIQMNSRFSSSAQHPKKFQINRLS